MLERRVSMLLVIAIARSAAADAHSPAPKPDVTTRLHRYYGTRAGYGKVYRDVMGWHKTTENGCVAFASTALRHVGVAIPIDGKKDGQGVSRITRSFARYLAEDLGWARIDDAGVLRPGDIVFTTDATCCPGYPAHVMMFDGWVGRGHVKARVVDNQGFHLTRAMTASEGSSVDGFSYALRPPAPITGSSAPEPAAVRDSSRTPP